MIDVDGKVHIYKYSRPQPDPKPDPKPDTDPDSFPIWAIILIVVGSLLIVGGIGGFIIYKRKQSLKQESYKSINDEKSRNGL